MKIELQFNQMVIDEKDLDSIVGSFIVPYPKAPPPHRKPTKRRRRTKSRITASALIDSFIDEITEG